MSAGGPFRAARREGAMKRWILASIAGCLLVISGCAPVQYTKADIDGRVVCNVDQMDQVERQARRGFTSVYWYNCPRAVLRVVS
jgi:hypothetical protein